MKPRIVLFVLLAVLSASGEANAQDLLKVPDHPYRKVGDKYYSLQPIYDWMKSTKSNVAASRPMKEWIGAPGQRGYGLYYEVMQVVPDGLLVRSSGEYVVGSESADFSSHVPLFLKNYPFKQVCVDGQKIRFLALKVGNYQYTGTDGAAYTVELYDYGVPYDPKVLQTTVQAKKTTNSVSTKPALTNRAAIKP